MLNDSIRSQRVFGYFLAGSRFSVTQQTEKIGRIPIVAAWFECWERDGTDDPPRGFCHASFRLPDCRLFLTYNLHLRRNAGGEPASNRTKREEAIRQRKLPRTEHPWPIIS